MAQTSTTFQAFRKSVTSFPSGNELYDQIMGDIEPDLLTAELPLLEEKYAGETPTEAAARWQRYEEAFAEYDRRYASFVLDLQTMVHTFQVTAASSVEAHSRGEESDELNRIEKSFSSAA